LQQGRKTEAIMAARVFLVEDLSTMRSLMADLLPMIGELRLIGGVSGEGEAKVWIEDHRGEWDLAIVDLMLEDGTGFGVVQHARQSNPRGKIVVFSSYVTPGIHAHCISLGADAAFDKAHSADFVEWLDSGGGKAAAAEQVCH
jgi:two-component system OmpR family response regulator